MAIRLTWRALLLNAVRHDVLQNFAVLLLVRKRFLHSWQVGRRSVVVLDVAVMCIGSIMVGIDRTLGFRVYGIRVKADGIAIATSFRN